MAKRKKKEKITKEMLLTKDEIEQFIEDKFAEMDDEYKEFFEKLLRTYTVMDETCQSRGNRLKAVLRILFDQKTEKQSKRGNRGDSTTRKKKKHGKNGADDYPADETVPIKHGDLESGSDCPACDDGNLYPMKPEVKIVVKAQNPFYIIRYEIERLRCNICNTIFKADAKKDVPSEKYDPSVPAFLGLMRFGYGMPSYRLSLFAENFGIPLAASTQWDLLEKNSVIMNHLYESLMKYAAVSPLIYIDDTEAKIIELMKKKNDEGKSRKMYTTAMVAVDDYKKVVLYMSGFNQAGTNLETLLKKRPADMEKIVVMCDGLAGNKAGETEVLMSNCNVHGRRKFIEVEKSYPYESSYVIKQYAKIYKYEKDAKELNLSQEETFYYRRRYSKPVMAKLHKWLTKMKIKHEPNAEMRKRFNYMLNRWKKLTLFLHKPGVPLDNNLCEQQVKSVQLYRKNALFYKTINGAAIGDKYMSIIRTCVLNDVNPFQYLKTVFEMAEPGIENIDNWMPWNYQNSISN